MEKPSTGWTFRRFIRGIFGGGTATTNPDPATPPIGGQIINGVMRFTTHHPRDNVTLLNQLREAQKYRAFIDQAARQYQLQPSLIAGIGSRESHWGLALTPPTPAGRGDFAQRPPRGERQTPEPPDGGGYGRGLMQIDYDWHEFARTGKWQDPRENILYGCKVLDDNRRFMQQRLPYLSPEQQLRAITAAYNCGATATQRAIEAGLDIDANTTGKDYSLDVFNRSGWFQLHGWQ